MRLNLKRDATPSLLASSLNGVASEGQATVRTGTAGRQSFWSAVPRYGFSSARVYLPAWFVSVV